MRGEPSEKPALYARGLFAAMVVGSVAAMVLSLLPIKVALGHYVTEDMFYYLTAARNIADGNIPSIDGHSPTNGFHPLWMLICTAIEALVSDSTLAYHVALFICGGLFVATGWLLYRIIQRSAGKTPALIVGALFLCNYRIIAIALGGLETALYGLAVVLLLGWLVSRGTEGLRSWHDSVILGLLLAFTYWSRLDALLLGVCVCGATLLLLGSGKPVIRRAALSAIAFAISLAATLPWFMYSFHSVGSPLPRSGVAIQAWSRRPTVGAILRGVIDPFNDAANVIGVAVHPCAQHRCCTHRRGNVDGCSHPARRHRRSS